MFKKLKVGQWKLRYRHPVLSAKDKSMCPPVHRMEAGADKNYENWKSKQHLCDGSWLLSKQDFKWVGFWGKKGKNKEHCYLLCGTIMGTVKQEL